MITLEQCIASTGLAPGELCLGTTPSTKHRGLLGSYLLNIKRGPEFVREMMVSDLRAWLDLGAVQQAADLLIVLRQFLSVYPEASFLRRAVRRGGVSPSRHFVAESNKSTATVSLHLVSVAPSTAVVESGR